MEKPSLENITNFAKYMVIEMEKNGLISDPVRSCNHSWIKLY